MKRDRGGCFDRVGRGLIGGREKGNTSGLGVKAGGCVCVWVRVGS